MKGKQMKKLLLCLTILSLMTTSVSAKPFYNKSMPHPAPKVVHHVHNNGAPLLTLASGILGFAVGTSIASRPQVVYTAAPVIQNNDKQCFVTVSKSNGNVTQHCVSGENQVLYVD